MRDERKGERIRNCLNYYFFLSWDILKYHILIFLYQISQELNVREQCGRTWVKWDENGRFLWISSRTLCLFFVDKDMALMK